MNSDTTGAPILVIGGGVAGLSACLALARRGLPSFLVERGERLGGRARELGCKATTECARCGACRLADLLREAALRPEITTLAGAGVSGASREDEAWLVELTPSGKGRGVEPPARALEQDITLRAGAVILAVGATPFDPSQKTRFGYRRVPGVISALELEQALEGDLGLLNGGRAPGRVAFIQCVGSRDESLGNLYCSRVCCGFALRMARLIRHRHPECAVTFFHMDVQGYGRAWEGELADLRADIRFVRAMPGEVYRGASGPEVVYAPSDGARASEEFDLVVLSQGLRPPVGAKGLAGMFGLERTSDGFLGSDADPVAGGGPGVFLAGTARGPMSIVESLEHGSLAAQAAAAYLAPDGGEAAHA